MSGIIFGIVMLLVATVLVILSVRNFYRLLREGPVENIPPEQLPQKYEENRELVLKMSLQAYIALLIISGSIPPLREWDPGFAFLLLVAFHFLASLRKVGAQEFGAVLLFEKPLYPLDQGLRFVPWLICKLLRETRLMRQDELPAEPEKIHRVPRDQPEVVPENLREQGFRPPIRITFASIREETEAQEGAKEKKEVDDPLQERVTAETPIIVWWRIIDFIRFRTTIGSIDEAKKQMGDAAVKVLSQHFPKITVAEALREKEKYDREISQALKDATASWGVQVNDAAVKNILLSHELNVEIQRIAEARAKRRRDMLEGQGAGAKEQAILGGRTAGLKKMAESLNVTPEAILAAETARAITSNPGQKTVIAGVAGFQELAGAVVGIAETFKESGKGSEKGGAQ